MDQQNMKPAHCLILPYPMQGHINPMLHFSKSLQQKGVQTTLITTNFMFKSLHNTTSIALQSISDGFDEGGRAQAESPQAYLTKFQQVGSESLAKLIDDLLNSQGLNINCVIYDSLLPWVLDVAKQFDLLGASFFTQSCAVDVIYYYLNKGILEVSQLGPKVFVPGLPPLEFLELPSFVRSPESGPAVLNALLNQFVNIDRVDWVLCNTFYKLEEEVINWMSKLLPMKAVGPTIPMKYLKDDQLKLRKVESDYSLHVYKPNVDTSMKWLSERQPESVIYVSFGSLAQLSAEQMEELAWGLKQTNKHVLWVVRESEISKLPTEFTDVRSEKILVVQWCSQMEVLAHTATGCFVTHCGWNSVLEAICLGVPMCVMPIFSDQSTNAKFVVDVWKIGAKIKGDEKGKVGREMVESCIKEVMDGDGGKEIKENAKKWKEMAKEAVKEGGSSDKCIDEFVAMLNQHP